MKSRIQGVLIENRVLQTNWKSADYDDVAEQLIKLRHSKTLELLADFCKRYNCSADYILGLSDNYYGGTR